jgi:hypothetical protein
MHGNDGYSKIAVLIGGSRLVDIKTDNIPPHLRGIGSKVLVVFKQGEEPFSGVTGEAGYRYDSVVVTDFVDGTDLGFVPAGR